MKFNCGLTDEEKWQKRYRALMALKAKRAAAGLYDWHDWYAWLPTRVGSGDCRWLETIQRRLHHVTSYDIHPEWQYRVKK